MYSSFYGSKKKEQYLLSLTKTDTDVATLDNDNVYTGKNTFKDIIIDSDSKINETVSFGNSKDVKFKTRKNYDINVIPIQNNHFNIYKNYNFVYDDTQWILDVDGKLYIEEYNNTIISSIFYYNKSYKTVNFIILFSNMNYIIFDIKQDSDEVNYKQGAILENLTSLKVSNDGYYYGLNKDTKTINKYELDMSNLKTQSLESMAPYIVYTEPLIDFYVYVDSRAVYLTETGSLINQDGEQVSSCISNIGATTKQYV
jgi:hypothetical protein